jgi:hypothetical protein
MNNLRRFATKEPTCCGVCRRRAWSIAYAPNTRAPLLWLCDETNCISLGKTVYNMAQKDLDAFELIALNEAGHDAGGYLDEIGVTDLAQLEPEQWITFLKRVQLGFEKHLREKLLSHAAPF